jgi:hypothetical protein
MWKISGTMGAACKLQHKWALCLAEMRLLLSDQEFAVNEATQPPQINQLLEFL